MKTSTFRATLFGWLKRCGLALALGGVLPCAGLTAETNPALPPIIQKGLSFYTSGGADPAVTAWREGGLMESDGRARDQIDRFKGLAGPLGPYKGCEVVDTKTIGVNSRIFYLCLLFERGGIYTRFVLYRTSKDWVVQHLEFSTRPEAVMPWLALEKEQ